MRFVRLRGTVLLLVTIWFWPVSAFSQDTGFGQNKVQSPNEFQQTNVVSDLIEENVGGFTEAFKNRVVIPFNGSFEDFRHVLHHELTHALIFDMLYGNILHSLFSRQALFNLPLWFSEGFAEFSSRHGLDYQGDMIL